jgi:predicted RNA-binding Zn-ribbon protein involved in translation (DUF1610 family)
MAPVKVAQTITTVCTSCQWTGQRSLEKGEDLATHQCPRCDKKSLTPEE